jgi:hypothetical protein
MKSTILCLAAFATMSIANAASVTNLFPNGDFEAGGAGDWVEGGCDFFSYPDSGGNSGGYGIIDDTSPCWGIWVGGDTTPLSLESLGLKAGQTYTFVQDMKIISGTSIGGIKIESWTTNNLGEPIYVSDSHDMRPLSGTAEWATYTFTYTIAPNATGLKVVPLWGPGSAVGFDNLGVVVVGATPASVSITSPTNNQVVHSDFTITATASVSPGTITNVNFYVDNVLAGTATNAPFGYIATSVAVGAHALKAVAMDSNGNSATSSVVNVTVTDESPTEFGAYEPFNYDSLADQTPTTATGFTSNWICGAAGTIVPGLTYPGLATANGALQSASSHQLTSLASVPSGIGTIWVSFLFKQVGDNGGNRDGFVIEDGTGKGIMFAYFQNQAAIGNPAIVNVSSFTTVGSTLSPHSATAQTYNANNFYVLKLAYSGGSLSSVAVYSNPTAGQDTAPAPDFTVSSGLSGIGLPNWLGVTHQGAVSITVDEVRVGSTFADVVGGNLNPTISTTLALSISESKKLSWSGYSTNYYQPQKSSDNSSWTDVGGLISGTNSTSAYDLAPESFYQVLEIGPVLSERIVDGGFEVDGGLDTAFYWNGYGTQKPMRITSDFHSGTASMSLMVTNVDQAAQTSDLQQDLLYAGDSGIVEGKTYSLSFWAKSLGKNPAGGYVQQYRVAWLKTDGGVVGTVGWTGFTSATDSWTQVSSGPVVAPAGAVNALIEVFVATGGILNDYGGVLVDDMSLSSFDPGSVINVLSPTVESGAAFTATVQTGGTTATAASGNVVFKINGVAQSSVLLTDGVAVSDPAIVPASYTVTATYSGDATYIGSSATQIVGDGGGVNPSPTNLAATVSGNQLTLSWPADHTGWSLQAQTNSMSAGLSATWFEVSGSTVTNKMTITVDPKNPTVFYRLKYTP